MKCCDLVDVEDVARNLAQDRRPLLVLLLRRRRFEPQVHVRTLCWSHGRARSTGRRARPQDRVARVRRERRRATERLRRLRPPRAARRRRSRARDPGEAQPRGSARARGRRGRSAAGRRARASTTRPAEAAGSRTSRTRRSSRRRRRRSTRRFAGSVESTTRRSSRSSRPSRSSTTGTRWSTRSRRHRTARRSASTAPAAGTRCWTSDKCWLTTDLGNAIREAVRDWARAQRLEAYDQAEHTGFLRHLVVREGRNTGQALVQLVTAPGHARRGQLRRRARALPRGAVDPLVGQRTAGRGDEPADAAPARRRRDRGGALRAALPGAAERVPADEHGDGRAALRARPRVRGSDRRGERLRPLLRDRDDRAHCWPATR